MLDAYIIDAIRQEQEERERDFARRRIQLEIPVYREPPPSREEYAEEDEDFDRGPIVIPLNPSNSPEEDAA
jgi:hypothetical protein